MPIIHNIVVGLVIGLASGVSPGPMQSLVLAQSARFGWRTGAITALAPLATDILIVAVTIGFVGILPHPVLDAVSVGGGLFVAYLAQDAWRSVQTRETVSPGRQPAAVQSESRDKAISAPRPASFWRATVVNLLNPHAWLFWALIGAPIAVRADHVHFADAAGFVMSFYLALVGVKVCLAIVVGHGTRWVRSNSQRWVVRASGLGMGVVSILLVATGVRGLIH